MSDEYYFSERAAGKVCDFIETLCRQSKGRWGNELVKLMPWQKDDFIRPFFGILNRETKLRKHRHASIWVPRRNGKTTLIAAVSLFMLCFDDEWGAEVLILSNTIKQSERMFDAAAAMVTQSPALSAILEVIHSDHTIRHHASYSKLQVLSSEVGANLGANASCLIFDEIGSYSDRKIFTNMTSSKMNRSQPVTITISTAYDILEGIGKEQFDLACKIRDGIVESKTFLPVIYAADPSDDWTSPETWKKANPSVGYTIQLADLEELAEEAKVEPRKEAEFKMFHLNLWQHSASAWLPVAAWRACGEERFAEADLYGCDAVIGMDLARRFDLAAYVLWIQRNGLHYLLPRFFCPKDLAHKKSKTDGVDYQVWARDGYIKLTPGDVIDYEYIRQAVLRDAKLFNVTEIRYDPYQGELLCNQQLGQTDGFKVSEVRQGILTMGPPTREFFRLVTSKLIRHNDNPILNWNAANAVLRTDANDNGMIDKKNSKSKVDGLTAAIIAGSAILTPDEWGQWLSSATGPMVFDGGKAK